MSLRQRTFRPGAVTTGGLQSMFDRAHHQVGRIEGNLTRALALDLDVQAGFCCLDDDFVVQADARARDSRSRGPRLALEAATTAVAVSPAGRVCVTGSQLSAQAEHFDDSSGVDGHRNDSRHALERRVGILEPVAGHRADHGRALGDPAVLDWT